MGFECNYFVDCLDPGINPNYLVYKAIPWGDDFDVFENSSFKFNDSGVI